MRGWSFPIGRFFGVDVRIHTFFLLLLGLSISYASMTGATGAPRLRALAAPAACRRRARDRARPRRSMVRPGTAQYPAAAHRRPHELRHPRGHRARSHPGDAEAHGRHRADRQLRLRPAARRHRSRRSRPTSISTSDPGSRPLTCCAPRSGSICSSARQSPSRLAARWRPRLSRRIRQSEGRHQRRTRSHRARPGHRHRPDGRRLPDAQHVAHLCSAASS